MLAQECKSNQIKVMPNIQTTLDRLPIECADWGEGNGKLITISRHSTVVRFLQRQWLWEPSMKIHPKKTFLVISSKSYVVCFGLLKSDLKETTGLDKKKEQLRLSQLEIKEFDFHKCQANG